MTEERKRQETTDNDASRRSGGADIDANDVSIGGDVVGRDKLIIHAEAGATVVVGERAVTLNKEAKPAEGEAPFKGLRYFDVGDAHLFFGRERLTAQLVGRLNEWRFLAVIGASGSGKSSLVRAGLVPTLKLGDTLDDGPQPPPGSEQWPIHVINPGTHPLEALASSLTRESESVTLTTTLIDDFKKDARSLHLHVRKNLSRTNADGLLLVIDQFEELFTLCRDEDERKAFVDNLMLAVDPDTGGPTKVVITLRADFYAHCAQYDNLREVLAKHQEFIGPMDEAELRNAIEEPATQNGWEFEPGLVDLLLRDAGAEPGRLPLLSHALLETWKRRQINTLTHKGYSESGGVQGAIAETAETIFNQLQPEQQKFARNIFIRLTELGEGTQDTRRRATLSELIPRPEDKPAIEGVLQTLADARLITTNEGIAEVAHEALIREWPQLRLWLDQDREGLRVYRHLTEAAQEWEQMDRDAGELYRGARLVQTEAWVSEHYHELNATEREFLETSRALHVSELETAKKLARDAEARAQAERRAKNRTRVSLILSLVLVVVLSIQPIYEEILRQQAMRAGTLTDITGGTYQLGVDITSTEVADQYLPEKNYELKDFAMELYEVTNWRYGRCIAAGICSDPADAEFDYAKLQRADYPVANVTALQASKFCQWIERRLPSEVEWELAARGPERNLWPWGNKIPTSKMQANLDYGSPPEPEANLVGAARGDRSQYGIFDLAGNVSEWTGSDYTDLNAPVWADTSSSPPRSLSVRGGNFEATAKLFNLTIRRPVIPTLSNSHTGFRCAVSR